MKRETRFFFVCFRETDARSGGLQAGVGYIAQVLKRNRTLRVCNLAENKIDVAGLVALAEALVSRFLYRRKEKGGQS